MSSKKLSIRGFEEEIKSKSLFTVFCIWTFILLCRPQDLVPELSAMRPALAAGLLTLILVVIKYRQLNEPPLFGERQVRYYAALIFILILGIPFSLYRRLSFMAVFTEYINVILFFFIFYKVVDSVIKLKTVLLLACIGNGLYSFFAIARGSFEYGRLSFGSMFDPNDLAFFALSLLPFNLLFISRDNPIWIRLACIGSFGSGTMLIFMTGSRGGLVAFAVVVSTLIVLKLHSIKRSLKLALIVLGVVMVFVSPIRVERYISIFSIEDDYNVTDETGRITIWKIGMNAMLANPLTGVGVSCFGQAVGIDREARSSDARTWQTAHNSFVQIGTETGIVGLILFMLMSFNVVRICNRARKDDHPTRMATIAEMAMIGFTGLFISGMFLSQAYSVYWAFYIVLSALVNRLNLQQRDKQPQYFRSNSEQ